MKSYLLGADAAEYALSRGVIELGDMKETHGEAAKIVEHEGLNLVPERTGRLKASIRSSAQAKTGVVRAGKKSVPYANPIHWGWPKRNIQPNPFLSNALSRKTPQINALYEIEVQNIVRRMATTP